MNQSIAFYDSGFGGLSVMRLVAKQNPQENFIYLADTENLPLGEKTPSEILKIIDENIHFLLTQNIKLLVIACHSVSSHFTKTLQSRFPIPILTITQSTQELIQKPSNIAILATHSTINSKIYQKTLFPRPCFVLACPLFVTYIEEGNFLALPKVAFEYLDPLKEKIETVLLACTHFPLIKNEILNALKPDTTLIDPSMNFANKIGEFLKIHQLEKNETSTSFIRFITSGLTEQFKELSKHFWETEITLVEKKSTLMKESALKGD